jgi:hypothetical protein
MRHAFCIKNASVVVVNNYLQLLFSVGLFLGTIAVDRSSALSNSDGGTERRMLIARCQLVLSYP